MLKKKKFIIAGLVLVIAFGFLLFLGFGTPVYSVSDLAAKGESIYDKSVRLEGIVEPGSINQDTENLLFQFNITDDTKIMPAIYRGIPPGAFWETEGKIVMEGKLTSDGVFQASKILTKCPSKYEAEQP